MGSIGSLGGIGKTPAPGQGTLLDCPPQCWLRYNGRSPKESFRCDQ